MKKTALTIIGLLSPTLALAHAGHDHGSAWSGLIHLLSSPLNWLVMLLCLVGLAVTVRLMFDEMAGR